ncbi:hypothetical protein LCP963914a_9908 [Penicillium roqueforti]|nr:hypothetical protein LCP963914a_9908 [Penicillium roqueforti]
MPKVSTSSRNSKGKTSSKPSQRALGSGDSSHRTLQAMAAGIEARSHPAIQDDRLRETLASKSKPAQNGIPADDDWEVVHRECLRVLDQAVEDKQKLQNKMSQERKRAALSIQTLRAETASTMDKIRELTEEKDQLTRKSQELEDEARRLRQEIEAAAGTQDQTAWNDIHPVLQQTHVNLLSAAHGVWSTMESLENRHLASLLPGHGVFQGPWSDPTAPLGMFGPSSLPGQSLPQPADVPPSAPQPVQ